MSNTVIVNFGNDGQADRYVVESVVLQSEFGGDVIGSSNASTDVSGGAVGGEDPLVSSMYSDTGSLDEAYYYGVEEWNAVKNISAYASGSNSMLFIADNFVNADIDFSNVTDTVELKVFNGKRSNILLGEGDDRIELSTATNKASWSNEHRIDTGDGDDIITVHSGDLSGGAILNYVDGSLTTIVAHLGDGDDVYGTDDGILTKDTVFGGKGEDVIFTGGGNDVLAGGEDRGIVIYDDVDDLYRILAQGDVLQGGAGADEFIYTTSNGFDELGDGFDHIVDFADEDVLTLNTQPSDVVTTEEVTVVQGADTFTGTMVFVNDDAAVFLQDFTNTSEIFS